MRCRVVVVLAVLGLSGCADETAMLGKSPPVQLETSRVVVVAPSRYARPTRVQLRHGIDFVARGEPQSVRAAIHMRSPGASETVRRELIGLGLDPVRLSIEPSRPNDTRRPQVVFSRGIAVTTPCAAAIQPGLYGDPSPSLLSLARCQQDNNLADMLVDPGDLVAPPHLGKQDGAYLANGVRAWRGTPSSTRSTAGSNDASGSGGSAPSAMPSAAASADVVAAPPAAQ